ncbi:MAG: hypothetical protein JW847_03080 [Candidatus Omnitrophica bacterium]|nr:hypothetical protein [Candidatus Omnitrophota bacterium]
MESIPQDMNVRQKIFESFLLAPILGYVVFSLIVAPFVAPPAYAKQVLHYKTYHPKTGEELNRFYGSMEENLSGGYQVHWVIEENGTATEEDYTLDEHFGTLGFRVVNVSEKTDYTGERRQNSVFIRGQYRGEKIEKTMPIDGRPFYYNPKIGLTAFVRSGKKQATFWGFQNRELKVYPMRATNGGPDMVSVNDRSVEAVKVYWTVDDFRSAFFKRTYWFRKSDGIFVKQKSEGGTFREMVSEEGRQNL